VDRAELMAILNTNVAGPLKTIQLLDVLRPGAVVVNIRERNWPKKKFFSR
jgi:hypothetical protein